MMRRRSRIRRAKLYAVAAAAVAVLALSAGAAWATGSLDQRQAGPADIWGIFCEGKAAQTFTAGLTGSLDTVELQISREGEGESAGDVVVSIVGTNSLADPGAPDEQDVLATQTIAEGDIPITELGGNVQTVVFDTPAAIQAGTKYAIMLSFPTCTAPEHGPYGYSWGMVNGDDYTAGDACTGGFNAPWNCSRPPSSLIEDFIFATYVTVPPPPPSADVAVSIEGPTSAKKATQITYVITVSNAGPDTAHNVVLTDPVPAGASFIGATTTAGSCTAPRRGVPIRCALGDLGAAGGAVSTASVRVTAKVGSTIANVVTARSTDDGAGLATPDPQGSNNTASLITTVTK